MKGRFSLMVKQPSLAIFNGKRGWFHDLHELIFTMVFSFFDESDQIIGMHFYTNRNFASGAEPNGALF